MNFDQSGQYKLEKYVIFDQKTHIFHILFIKINVANSQKPHAQSHCTKSKYKLSIGRRQNYTISQCFFTKIEHKQIYFPLNYTVFNKNIFFKNITKKSVCLSNIAAKDFDQNVLNLHKKCKFLLLLKKSYCTETFQILWFCRFLSILERQRHQNSHKSRLLNAYSGNSEALNSEELRMQAISNIQVSLLPVDLSKPSQFVAFITLLKSNWASKTYKNIHKITLFQNWF